jgi:hypothetical protein
MTFAVLEKGKKMTDYIKREDALDIVAHNNVSGEITLNRYDKIIDGIYEIPSADVAPVVRCGDCLFCHRFANDSNDDIKSWCLRFLPKQVNDDDFCAWGERKDDE